MKNKIKNLVKALLQFLKLDLTKNLEYDRLTKVIIKAAVNANSSAIDVGCHKGEILDLFFKYAPNGKHYAFEPIPEMFNQLKLKYKNNASIYPYALSDVDGSTVFNFVKNAPAYSGIRKRNYAVSNPDIEEIKVEMRKLDSVLSDSEKIDLIKIDVEGAELGVLIGAHQLILKNKPLIIFECGLGASDFYGTKPEDIFNFLATDCNMNIYLLKSWINKGASLDFNQFNEIYSSKSDYYFVADCK